MNIEIINNPVGWMIANKRIINDLFIVQVYKISDGTENSVQWELNKSTYVELELTEWLPSTNIESCVKEIFEQRTSQTIYKTKTPTISFVRHPSAGNILTAELYFKCI